MAHAQNVPVENVISSGKIAFFLLLFHLLKVACIFLNKNLMFFFSVKRSGAWFRSVPRRHCADASVPIMGGVVLLHALSAGTGQSGNTI